MPGVRMYKLDTDVNYYDRENDFNETRDDFKYTQEHFNRLKKIAVKVI